jgi:hypothetical protein
MESPGGRKFRDAWIAGVKTYYSGEPKPGYIAPWDDMPEWEQASADAVYRQASSLIQTSSGGTAKLSRAQKGQFIALCWIVQIYKHFPDPKPSYVADWIELPEWQQETDSDIFESIESGS